MRARQALVWPAALLLLLVLHVQVSTPLDLRQQWHVVTGMAAEESEALLYVHSHWPRALMAVLVGAMLACSGSLLQLLTRNPLLSPMTLGLSAGSWCALVLNGLLWASAGLSPEAAALVGGLLALLLAGQLAGWRHLHASPIVVAGTAVNLLLGGVAAVAIMLHDQYARSLLVWGAGDLAQNDWYWLHWLWPRLLPVLLALPLLARPLQMLQLGPQAAGAAGVPVRRVGALALLLALWLNSLAVAAVGLISFVSLLAPAAARLAGARTARAQLLLSAVAGSTMLLLADALACLLSSTLPDRLPTSATVAVLGAPLLIALCLRQPVPEAPLPAVRAISRPLLLPGWLAGAVIASLLALCLLLSRDVDGHWLLDWPDERLFDLRWPRLLAALAAGSGMAIAGVVLQRLLHNPLASPDLLGISAGASLGVVAGLLGSVPLSALSCAMLGAALVLFVLCVLAPRHGSGTLLLFGIALTALLEGSVQFVIAQGNNDSLQLLNWLSGSTYNTQGVEAAWLAAGVAALGVLALAVHRVLDVLQLGAAAARALGLDLAHTRVVLLLLVGLLTVLVCSRFGPLAFVGLVVPHLARLAGARNSLGLLAVSAVLGGAALSVADLSSRTLAFPAQLPTGAVASVLCGVLVVLALLRRGAHA